MRHHGSLPKKRQNSTAAGHGERCEMWVNVGRVTKFFACMKT